MKLLVVTPMERERRCIGSGVSVMVSGTGEAAGGAVRAALDADRPDLVVIAGFGGGLDPSLRAGALVLCRGVVAADRPEIKAHAGAIELMRTRLRAGSEESRLGFVTSRAVTVRRPLGGRRQKTRIWNEHGAAAADMETYAIAEACVAAGVPWLALRTVLDTAATTLPRSLRRWQGTADERRILGAAIVRPFEWPAYARLALQYRKAAAALRRSVAIAREVLEPVQSLDAADAAARRRRESVPITLVEERPA